MMLLSLLILFTCNVRETSFDLLFTTSSSSTLIIIKIKISVWCKRGYMIQCYSSIRLLLWSVHSRWTELNWPSGRELQFVNEFANSSVNCRLWITCMYSELMVPHKCQHSSKDRTHHTDTTLLLEVCVCVWRGCGVAVVCLCGRSAWCAWSLDEGWHLWATIRTDWASTVPVSLQPIASWRWRAWPMNTSCNWVDLLQAGQFSFSSVYVLRTNLYRQFEDR